jgi:hypothetical protein
MPKIVEVHLSSVSPYSQSRQHDTPKLNKETWDSYEQRTWREKCTVDSEGNVVMPAMALKQALDAVAKRLSEQIPGKGKSTFTKHFASGVICEENVVLVGCEKENCPSVTINANADGKRGSGKRVKRTFPQWPKWSGVARFAILDDTVTPAVFERHLNEAGRFIGVGRFRPENGGLNGRFRCEKFVWSDV